MKDSKAMIMFLRKKVIALQLKMIRQKSESFRGKIQLKIIEIENEIGSLGGVRIKHHFE